MKLHPRVTPPAVDLVKRFEGFRPRAAKTPDGRFTIGYGHVLSPRDSADEAAISEPEAEFLLQHDLAVTAEAIEQSVLAPVNDNQFAALLSFAFNIGVDNFKGCSALRRLNEGAYLQAAAALELWRRADFGGEILVVDQLVRRRAVEKALFLAPPEGFMPLPSSVLRPAFDHSVVGAAVAWAAARERTAVSRIALEGPEAALGLATPPGREGEPAPSAAIAAADALAVRLSRILPEDETHDEDALQAPQSLAAPHTLHAEPASTPAEATGAEPEVADFEVVEHEAPAHEHTETATLLPFDAIPADIVQDQQPQFLGEAPARAPTPPETATPLPAAVLDFTGVSPAMRADAPLSFQAPAEAFAESATFASTPKRDDSGFDLPPPPVLRDVHPESQPVTFARPEADAPAPQVLYDEAEHAAEPPPLVGDTSDFAASTPWRRRFGARSSQRAPFEAVAPADFAPSLFDPPSKPVVDDFEEGAVNSRFHVAPTAASPVPLFERPVFFQVLGLIGIALFAGSIFCMMHKASFGCLLIGVVGILAMAPAAAFFLFRFLGQPVDPTSAEHADLATMMQAHDTLPETETPPAPAATTETADSPFDAAWR